jgi:hypothetical protein
MRLKSYIEINYGFSINKNTLSGGSFPTVDPDALAWFNAVEATGANFGSSPASITSNKSAFNTAFLSMKSSGIWNAIRQACFLVGPSTVAGALVNIKLTGNPTNNNFASGDYNRLTGLKGNGSNKYLNTNISLPAGSGYSNNHLYTNLTDEGTSAGLNIPQFVIGSNYNGASGKIMCYYYDVINFGRGYRFTQNTQSASEYIEYVFVPASEGKIGFSRSGLTFATWAGQDNGGWIYDESTGSNGVRSGNNFFLFRDPSSSTTNFDGRSAFYSIGSYLDLPALDGIVETLKGSLIN